MEAPMKGEWLRAVEYEGMMKMVCGELSIRVEFPCGEGKELERWLVESLHLWPHPNAIWSEDEYDYPNHRNECYARLMSDDGKRS